MPIVTLGIAIAPIENPGVRSVAKYNTIILSIHENNPNVIRLIGSKIIERNGRIKMLSRVNTIPIVISAVGFAKCTWLNTTVAT